MKICIFKKLSKKMGFSDPINFNRQLKHVNLTKLLRMDFAENFGLPHF